MTDLAGIGDVLGKRLSGKGFDKVDFKKLKVGHQVVVIMFEWDLGGWILKSFLLW